MYQKRTAPGSRRKKILVTTEKKKVNAKISSVFCDHCGQLVRQEAVLCPTRRPWRQDRTEALHSGPAGENGDEMVAWTVWRQLMEMTMEEEQTLTVAHVHGCRQRPHPFPKRPR